MVKYATIIMLISHYTGKSMVMSETEIYDNDTYIMI